MVKLLCLVRRKPGMSPEDFHTYWRETHGPLVLSTKSGGHVLRYEQHHRPLDTYASDPDGWDGATVQWYASPEDFVASIREDDYRVIDEDMAKFLDTDRLEFVVTEEPDVLVDRLGAPA